MKHRALRFRTLTQRFGALYALLIAILIGVVAGITVHLRRIGVDSERLIEEAREQTSVSILLSEIDALEALLRQSSEIDLVELARARELLRETRLELSGLEGPVDDPSRDEHQEAENRISERLEVDLAEADALLVELPDEDDVEHALALLESARHFAAVLLAEARTEALETNEDLQRRTRSTTVILVTTWGAAVLLLSASLVLVQRGVVRPLRRLRAGTERFGEGDTAHRIQVDNDDEIGDLAASFNDMADRLAKAREHLEERVRKRTQEFLRAARLADLGILASGIAHEINTPLASIASSAEGLERRCTNGTADPDVVSEYGRTISEEAFRAREITTRMLALVRQQPSEISSVPLGAVFEQAVSALRHRAQSRGVRLLPPTVPEGLAVQANAGELVQMLVNLLCNAVDATPRGGEVECGAHVDGDTFELFVRDEGVGIPEEDLDRIFEPFYTTKRAGEGTGLGLALVATMVESHGGRLSVESEPGRGSEFRAVLPLRWR